MIQSFAVLGKAETKGSAKAFKCGDRCIITNDNPRCKKWQKSVSFAAQTAGIKKRDKASVHIVFRIAIPKTFLKKRIGGDPHTLKPDIDKLIRPILDALTGIAYDDDNAVYEVYSRKIWWPIDLTEITISD